ncbi:hypothetical protein CUMW_271370 [Citrus unshiu]|uniref:Uncharacterized protein n=1 Tax=Citrus unshiu TaxID=55188 RepID=A0A2H5QXP2_CITUN|nr:hypothetical protein CUMW_271370 [Citrus unshiu]
MLASSLRGPIPLNYTTRMLLHLVEYFCLVGLKRWEKEIDWMALQDQLALAFTGQETFGKRVVSGSFSADFSFFVGENWVTTDVGVLD